MSSYFIQMPVAVFGMNILRRLLEMVLINNFVGLAKFIFGTSEPRAESNESKTTYHLMSYKRTLELSFSRNVCVSGCDNKFVAQFPDLKYNSAKIKCVVGNKSLLSVQKKMF